MSQSIIGKGINSINNLRPSVNPVRKAVMEAVTKRIEAAELAYAEEAKGIDSQLKMDIDGLNFKAQVEKEQALADSVASILTVNGNRN